MRQEFGDAAGGLRWQPLKDLADALHRGVPQPQVVFSGSWRISRRGRLAGSFSRLGACFSPADLAVGCMPSISAATAARSPSRVSSSRLFCSAL